MGAAMAPAAAETIICHLDETQRKDDYYDAIVTGDLGTYGSELLMKLTADEGHDLSAVHKDCGAMIYSGDPLAHCGGSGCGCSASLLNGYFLNEMRDGRINKILFVATGALHSPTSTLQGETIPCIAHAVSIEMGYGQ